MKVKICGITDLYTALKAESFGADAIGFVFAKSKRQITPEAAGEISAQLSPQIEKVGVFVNETKERIEEIVSQAKLTMVQLHGDESPDFCLTLSVPVIKALSIGSKEDLIREKQYHCEFILLDSPKGKYHGGTGVPFNWGILQDTLFTKKKIILAGGLNLDNVTQAITQVKPYMLDVSSGVESEGKKDINKIKVFIEKTKSVVLLNEKEKNK